MQQFFVNLSSTWWGVLILLLSFIMSFLFISAIFYKQFFKRFYDIVFSIFFIILLSPLLFVLTILGAINFKGKPFFVQDRPGKHEKIFKCLKFKTMRDIIVEADNEQSRLTKYGIFLRKTSLDELPQLFNILLGQMSFVGPRPLLVEYLPLYSQEQRHRHDVKPGLTGYAQIKQGNHLEYSERFERDLYYIKHISMSLDFKIILKTFVAVFFTKKSKEADATVCKRFKGNNTEQLVIIGAGGHGGVANEIAKLRGYNKIIFLDDNYKNINRIDVVGSVFEFEKYISNSVFFVAIGDNETRKIITEKLKQNNAKLINLIHPSAVVSEKCSMGLNIFVGAKAVVNCETKLADGVILNTDSSVDHNCDIGEYSHICVNAHLSGSCIVGKLCLIGASSSVINNIKIIDNAIVGAGAVVVKNIEESGTYVGVPAKIHNK